MVSVASHVPALKIIRIVNAVSNIKLHRFIILQHRSYSEALTQTESVRLSWSEGDLADSTCIGVLITVPNRKIVNNGFTSLFLRDHLSHEKPVGYISRNGTPCIFNKHLCIPDRITSTGGITREWLKKLRRSNMYNVWRVLNVRYLDLIETRDYVWLSSNPNRQKR
jgi:hypothetical protein